MFFALVKVGSQVLAIGGFALICLPTVSSHNLINNTWASNLPPMNKGRSGHAACLLGFHVFVFAGAIGFGKFANSIEKIHTSFLESNGTIHWTLIELREDSGLSRERPAVAPLNESDIVILGGQAGLTYLGDVIIFDTITETCQKVVS